GPHRSLVGAAPFAPTRPPRAQGHVRARVGGRRLARVLRRGPARRAGRGAHGSRSGLRGDPRVGGRAPDGRDPRADDGAAPGGGRRPDWTDWLASALARGG